MTCNIFILYLRESKWFREYEAGIINSYRIFNFDCENQAVNINSSIGIICLSSLCSVARCVLTRTTPNFTDCSRFGVDMIPVNYSFQISLYKWGRSLLALASRYCSFRNNLIAFNFRNMSSKFYICRFLAHVEQRLYL